MQKKSRSSGCFSRRFWRAEHGATLIEFAIVAPILFLMLFGILEYGLMQFSAVAIESATMQAAREVSLGKTTPGCNTACLIQDVIKQKTQHLINSDKIVVTINKLSDGGALEPEYCNTNPPQPGNVDAYPPSGCPNAPDGTPFPCLEDLNGDPTTCRGNTTLNTAAGGDILEIRITYPWKLQVPLMETILGKSTIMISSATLVKNEPF